MKKHLKLFMLAALAVITIGACKKDKKVDPVTESECKLAQFVVTHNGNADITANLTYETDGKLKSFTDGTDVTSYTYSTDKIVINESGTIVNVTLANGKAVKLQKAGSTNYYEYIYTTDGYLSKVKYYSNGVYQNQDELFYTNDNVSKITYSNTSGVTEDILYEYGTDLNKSNIAIADPILMDELTYYIPVEYMGKQHKNVIIKSSNTYTSGIDRTDNLNTYTYTKDSNGNYTSIDHNQTDKHYANNVLTTTNTDNYKYSFTYNCN